MLGGRRWDDRAGKVNLFAVLQQRAPTLSHREGRRVSRVETQSAY